jgi:hypothetical protein
MTATTVMVPPGISGRPARFDASEVSLENVACELALLQLGDFEPLNIKIDCHRFMSEISVFKDAWVDYLPRTDRANNRKGLTLTNLPGKSHLSVPSLAQASVEANRKVSELEFCEKTDVYRQCKSLHGLLDQWDPIGRSFLVRCGIGGHFMPHRDHPSMPREVLRLAVFLNNCDPMQFDWINGIDQKLAIERGRVYYVNTRKTHRTFSWTDDSIHLILNIPVTNDNVARIIANLQHTH